MKAPASTVPAALRNSDPSDLVRGIPKPRYMTPEQLLERWEGIVTSGTLANWRSRTNKGTPAGPAFAKFGTRVRYPTASVEAYERANLHGEAINEE